MKKENRRMKPSDNKKTILYGVGSIALIIILAIIAIYIIAGGTNTSDESKFSTAKISNLVPNTPGNTSTTQASTQIGKSINEVKTEMDNIAEKDTNVTTDNSKATSNSVDTSKKQKNTNNESSKTKENIASSTNNSKNENEIETSKLDESQLVFSKPVDGEIIREYAKDKLVYSETLKEWITHTGVDIKAEKTSVVKAAAEGKVSSIKNDPRYGLTVVIEHQNGFKTVYSNLLTAEFVTEGEEIAAGQTIGTVGNSANFEILDESHLHFEILKDNESLDPTIYIQ